MESGYKPKCSHYEPQVRLSPAQVKGAKGAGHHRLELLALGFLQSDVSMGGWQAHSLVVGRKQPSQFKTLK